MKRSCKVAYSSFLIAAFMVLLACHGKKPQPPKPQVEVETVALSTVPVYKNYIGLTQSIASVDIRARVQGFLVKMNYTEGKPVKKNQLIYVIDPSPFEAQLKLSEGQLSEKIADRNYTEVQYLRMKNLVAKGDISKSDYDSAMAKYAESVAAVQVAEAQVQTAKINLDYCYMYSPIDGLISKKYVDLGNLVGGAENTLLTNIVVLDPMYVEFSPSVNDFGDFLKYRENMPFKVEATLPQNDQEVFQGSVDLINNQAVVETSTILMRATIKNKDLLLRPNIYLNLKLHLSDTHQGILVPIKAVMESQGRRTVFVVGKDNKLEARVITISDQIDEKYVVESGLKSGEVLVVNGLQKARPGEEVVTHSANSKEETKHG